ncbi:hypothetical protein HDU98_000397 [Podochytrium sp. JEL0797]|nr:hypothetical protein HDU98_000397 [Podochytrium sp. JEL0797]
MMELYLLTETNVYPTHADDLAPRTRDLSAERPRLQVSLFVNYNATDGRYFGEEVPVELVGLMSTLEFQTRIKKINHTLHTLSFPHSIKDFGAMIRMCLFLLLSVYSIVIVILIGNLSAFDVWAAVLAGLVAGCVGMGVTFRKKKCVQFLEEEMRRLTELDREGCGLVWGSVRQGSQAMYSCDPKSALVPWKIVVKKVGSAGDGCDDEEGEFLPRYCGVDMVHSEEMQEVGGGAAFLTCEMERVPSYKSRCGERSAGRARESVVVIPELFCV